MALETDVQAYIQQWLATAGDFTWSWSRFQDRFKMVCNECNAQLTVAKPTSSDSIEWELQEWVKRHGKGGPHDNAAPNPMDVIPMTADFKEVALEATAANDAPSPQAAVIDKSSAKAAQIQAQMKKYLAEKDYAKQQAKIAELQSDLEAQVKQVEADNENLKSLATVLSALEEMKYPILKMKPSIPFNTTKVGQPLGVGAIVHVNNPGDYAIVDGEKIYWKKDANGKVVGVAAPAPEPPALPKTAKITKGRRFR